jgi:hypothetical protein
METIGLDEEVFCEMCKIAWWEGVFLGRVD